jgi:ABC-type nitrate/sulfonate/bicarbonate transport system permease component
MLDLPAAIRIFIETLAYQTIAVALGLLIAAAIAVAIGVGCRLYDLVRR